MPKEVHTNTMTSLDRWQRTLEPFAGVGFDRGAAGAIAAEGPNSSNHRVRTIYSDTLDAPTAAHRARSGEISPNLQEASKIGTGREHN